MSKAKVLSKDKNVTVIYKGKDEGESCLTHRILKWRVGKLLRVAFIQIATIGITFVQEGSNSLLFQWQLMPQIFNTPKDEHDQQCSHLVVLVFAD